MREEENVSWRELTESLKAAVVRPGMAYLPEAENPGSIRSSMDPQVRRTTAQGENVFSHVGEEK